jgi:cysteine desulfurase/selenocysteine lyase
VNTRSEILSNETAFDVMRIREDFPILKTLVRGKPLIYLDNAATTQKPQQVIDSLSEYYSSTNSNIHRGVHTLSEKATREFEEARVKVKKFINAASEKEIIFTRGTTESINLVANSFGRSNLNEGDEILITGMEHHSNIVPWQLIASEKNAMLKAAPITDSGELILEEFEKLITERTKIISVVYLSNSLGTINPVEKIIEIAHKHGVPVLLDAAQAVSHIPVDVQKLDCDFFAFSGHKIYGPTGIGILYGKEKLLEQMPPFMGGGDMISRVTFAKTTYNELPYKFEAGTSNIADAIGLGAALDYVNSIGMDSISKYEKHLLDYTTNKLSDVEGLRIIGTAAEKSSVISFVLKNVHPHDVGTFLDFEGIAVRTGHHCTQPLMDRFSIPATSRASFALYNTIEEADVLVRGIKKVIEAFS